MIDELLLILRHPKKIILFGYLFWCNQVIGTFTVDQLALNQKSFTAGTVKTAVFVKVDISCIIYVLKNLLNHSYMILIRCSDKTVIIDVEKGPGVSKHSRNIIDILTRFHMFLGGRFNDFVAMFIRSGLKSHLVST